AITGKFDFPSTWTYPTSGNSSSTSIEVSGLNDFSDFQVADACIDPDPAVMSASPGDEVCIGSTVRLSIISGDLNDATDWNWYTGSCGGSLIGTGLFIDVTPSVTTTYFVRGEGGCSVPGTCVEITIIIDEQPIVSIQPDQ